MNNMVLSCAVCGQKSSGFHYGAFCCEACKVFFKRSAGKMLPASATCVGSCEPARNAATGKRTFTCPLCRMNNCINAGMTKKGARRGRRSYEEKALEIIKMRESMRAGKTVSSSGNETGSGNKSISSGDVNETSSVPPESPDSSTTINLSPEELKYEDQEDQEEDVEEQEALDKGTEDLLLEALEFCGDQRQGNAVVTSSTATLPAPDNTGGGHPKINLGAIKHTHNAQPPGGSGDATTYNHITQPQPTPQPTTNTGPFSCTRHTAGMTNSPLPTIIPTNSVIPHHQGTPPSPHVVTEPQLEPESPVDSKPFVAGVISQETINHYQFPILPDIECGATCLQPVKFSGEDIADIIQNLIQVHKQYYSITEETMLLKQKAEASFKEDKNLLDDLFGALPPISPSEHLTIYQETGIDIDGRLDQFKSHLPALHKHIQAQVAFLRAMPQFISLPTKDKIAILKGTKNEELGFSTLGLMNESGNLVFNLFSKALFSLDLDMKVFGDVDHARRNTVHLQQLQSFHLNDEELMLLKAVAVYAPDRCATPEGAKITGDLQQQFAEQLQKVLATNHPEDPVLFARIMGFLATARTVIAYNDYNVHKMIAYYQHELKIPIHIREMWSPDGLVYCPTIPYEDVAPPAAVVKRFLLGYSKCN